MNISYPLTKHELDTLRDVHEKRERKPLSDTESLLVVLGFLSLTGRSVTINRAGRLRLETELSLCDEGKRERQSA